MVYYMLSVNTMK